MKNPRRTWKLTYDRLPRVNHDLGWSGNCKWEAALAKLTIGGDECNRYSYRSETDRRRWEPSCRLSHSDVEGKEKPPRYDLIAATKALWWNHLVLNFPEIEQSPQLDLRAGIASDRIIKQEVNRKDFNILSLLKIWHQRITTVANWMHYKSRVKLVNLRRDFWICEIGTGRQVAQLHDRYMMMIYNLMNLPWKLATSATPVLCKYLMSQNVCILNLWMGEWGKFHQCTFSCSIIHFTHKMSVQHGFSQ